MRRDIPPLQKRRPALDGLSSKNKSFVYRLPLVSHIFGLGALEWKFLLEEMKIENLRSEYNEDPKTLLVERPFFWQLDRFTELLDMITIENFRSSGKYSVPHNIFLSI